MFGSFFNYFGYFLVLERTLGALGAKFSSRKRFGPPKAPQYAFPPKSGHFIGAILESFLEPFGVFFELFF